LARLYRAEKDLRRRERYQALYLLSLGYPQNEIATIVCKDEDTIGRWKQQWESKKKVDDEPRSGRPPELDDGMKKKIAQLVDEDNPHKHGFNVAHWDCKELRRWLALRGVSVSQEAVRNALVENGFRYVKTGYELARADKKEQKSFVSGFRRFLRGKDDVLIAFMDEMSSKLHPKQGYVWTRMRKPVVATHDSHKRVFAAAAVMPETGRVVARISNRFNQHEFIKFLGHLLSRTRKKIVLFIDGMKAHKTAAVKKFLKEHPRLKIRFLPKYSPKLNLAEYLWGYTRQKRTNNVEFRSQRSLMSTLQNWFVKMPPDVVKSVCNYSCILGSP